MRSPSTGEVEDPLSACFPFCRQGTDPAGTEPVEGLRMTQAFAHRAVMADEVAALLAAVPDGVLVDATLGGGGHAAALLAAHSGLQLVGVDRDADALAAAAATLAPFGDRVVALHHARFDQLPDLVAGLDPVTAVLFDLGVSSPQLDWAERGFSYRFDGPLDMRMDRSQRRTAADVANTAGESELARMIALSGERRFARRVARAMVAARPLTTTVQLAEVVRSAVPAPARRRGGHPARAVFQALRIAVNDELDVLGPTIDAAIDLLAPGGRLVVLAYHSGEDRIVKDRLLTGASGGCVCPPGLPCVCGAVPLVRLLNRGARKPTPAEVAANPRAESARLRAAERLVGAGEGGGGPGDDDLRPDERGAAQ
jgi:16S rRNA (cytosine1402-N4)-methyltransferase